MNEWPSKSMFVLGGASTNKQTKRPLNEGAYNIEKRLYYTAMVGGRLSGHDVLKELVLDLENRFSRMSGGTFEEELQCPKHYSDAGREGEV